METVNKITIRVSGWWFFEYPQWFLRERSARVPFSVAVKAGTGLEPRALIYLPELFMLRLRNMKSEPLMWASSAPLGWSQTKVSAAADPLQWALPSTSLEVSPNCSRHRLQP